jgi:glycosyltransferase involved in cell wall biosynthesis
VRDNGFNAARKEGDIFHLLSCSNMTPVKRVSLIIEALKHVDIEINWTHIGTGKLRDEITNAVKTLPHNVHVNLLGLLSNKEVLDYYRCNHVDLFINVSKSEGVPVSIMEAFSFGVPAAATNVGGTGEIVDDSVGKLFDVNVSPQEIAETIKSFANSETFQYRDNARNRWNERCNAEKNYIDFVCVLSA